MPLRKYTPPAPPSKCGYPEMNLLSKFFSPILKGQLQRSRCTVPVFIGPILKCANIGNTQVQINTTATLSYDRSNFAAYKYFDNNKNKTNTNLESLNKSAH